MDTLHVLVVDKEPSLGCRIADAFEHEPLRLSLAASANEALTLLERERVQVIVVGLEMCANDEEFVRRAATIQPLLAMVVIVDPTRIQPGPPRNQAGSIEYVARPAQDAQLSAAVRRALRAPEETPCRGRNAGRGLRRRPGRPPGDGCRCPAHCREQSHARDPGAGRASRSHRRSGSHLRRTGNGQGIHRPRDTSPEPAVRGPLPADRLRHAAARGAGRGAFQPQPAAPDGTGPLPGTPWEKARGGTLFLADVDQLPPWSQTMLLESLQHGTGGGLGGEEHWFSGDGRGLPTSA